MGCRHGPPIGPAAWPALAGAAAAGTRRRRQSHGPRRPVAHRARTAGPSDLRRVAGGADPERADPGRTVTPP
ncbi:MYXO-CTERM sorting domain-containing protein [Mycobacterium sp. UM_Kg1]|uniref:MYXO-CTERM sorting domain-containing protein n=1 Tax=Mycobacterium sp. UM_Kg1 TaxID=1545691 RepID=UPI00336A07C3